MSDDAAISEERRQIMAALDLLEEKVEVLTKSDAGRLYNLALDIMVTDYKSGNKERRL